MKSVPATLACTAVLALAGSAHALTQFVTNGDFSTNSIGTSDGGQVDYDVNHKGACTSAANCVTISGWAVPTGGYTFLFAAGDADTTGANGSDGIVKLWGPGDSSNNGFTAIGPTGGPILAQDSDFQEEPIQQSITGLKKGDRYTVTFDWAGAQQTVQSGASDDQYEVTLSKSGAAGTCTAHGTSQCTSIVDVKAKGFSGWQTATMTFVASSRTEILSFLAKGTISGEPSFALLDDVSMTQATPEPATWALMFLGVAGVGGAMRRRRRSLAAA